MAMVDKKELLERHIKLEGPPSEARLRQYGQHVWAIIGYYHAVRRRCAAGGEGLRHLGRGGRGGAGLLRRPQGLDRRAARAERRLRGPRLADLYLDHNVSREVAERLRGWGHNATTARDHQLDAATDEQQFLFARAHGRVLVTHNQRDFLLLHRAWLLWPVDLRLEWPFTHSGILLLDVVPFGEIAEALRRRLDGWSRWLRRTEYAPIGVG